MAVASFIPSTLQLCSLEPGKALMEKYMIHSIGKTTINFFLTVCHKINFQ